MITYMASPLSVAVGGTGELVSVGGEVYVAEFGANRIQEMRETKRVHVTRK